jgi:hypothetical protein
MRLDVRQWKKGCQAFLTAWEHKICDLAELDPKAVTESKKWHWLCQAVLPHKTMEAAITNFDSLDKFARKMTPDGDGLGFQEMFNQLMDAATRHERLPRIMLPTNSAASRKASFKLSPTRKVPRIPVMGRKLMRLLFGSIICRKIGRSCQLRKGSRFLSNARSLRVRRNPYANLASTTNSQSLSTEALAGAAPIHATVVANQAQIDAQSVASSSSALTVVSGSSAPGSTTPSMLSNAAHL